MANVWNGIKARLRWTSKKDAYILLSLVIMVSLTTTIVYDLVHLFGTENSDKTTQKFTMALLASFHFYAFRATGSSKCRGLRGVCKVTHIWFDPDSFEALYYLK